MSSRTNEENVMRMTKDELQRWIQAEVDRNPQLVQRHQQLAQVEEWVKEKEREATNTRLLYSNACESILECESGMKGLYGMLGLEYRDEDSEEEEGAGGSKKPWNIIQITDNEEAGKEKSVRDNDDDIVVVDLGAAQETLEPMLEKVTVAMERSSRLVQDLVQMVSKTSSIGSESTSGTSSRPSSTSTPETSLFESSPPINHTLENVELTDNTFAIIKTESLSTAIAPEMFYLSNSHNTGVTATIKTEPQLTPLTLSEISSLPNNCNDHTTTVLLLKTEPESMTVTPDLSSLSSNSKQLETIDNSHYSNSIATIKTEPQFTLVKSETSSFSNNFKQFNDLTNTATVKTEPQFTSVSTEISSPPTGPEQSETTNQNSDSMTTLKAGPSFTITKPEQPQIIEDSVESIQPQLTVMTSEKPSVLSTSKLPKTLSNNSTSKATSASSSPSRSEQDNTVSNRKMPSPDRKAIQSPKTRLRSSTTASSITNTPSSQKETRSSSTVDSIDDPDNIEEPNSHTQCEEAPKPPSVSSTNTSAKKTTSNTVSSPSSSITKPAASAQSSDAKQVFTTPSSNPKESFKTPKEIELKIGTVVLGRWKCMSWHRGTVLETQTTEHGHKYNVEFKNRKNCLLPAHHVACMKPPMLKDLYVGCRVVVGFKDDQEKLCYRAAVLAELPDRKNRMRFLVFYDDGRVGYVALPDLHIVCKQLRKVWKDIEDEATRLQVKEYIRVFPNPISVVLRVGQDAKAERDGKFEPCTIDQLDGSLIQICFKSDKQKEWLFKGSERLEHIVNIKKRLSQQKKHQPTKAEKVPQRNTSPPQHISTRATRQSESTATKAPSLMPQNNTSSASPMHVTHQTDTTVTKASSVSPQNTTSAVSSSCETQKNDTTVSKTPSLSPQNATSAVKQQTDITITKEPSVIPQNITSGVTRQTDTTITKEPSIIPQNITSGVTRQTDTTITKAPSVIPQNITSGVTRQTDATITKAPSVIPQNITSGVTRQTDTTVTKEPSVIPQNITSGVTRQTDTTVTKASSISLENAMSAAFQPKVVLQKLVMPLSIPPAVSVPKTAVKTGPSATADSILNLRSAKRPAPDEIEEHVSDNNQTKSRGLFHHCCPACLDGVRPKQVDMHHGQNPLQIPLLFNFRRMTARRRLDGNVFFHIFYRSPCGRSLCDMQEVQEYLFETHCDFLFLEMFCMDPFVLVNRARPPSTTTSQPYLYQPDISEGKEVFLVPCVNEVDRTPAPSVAYIKDRMLAPGVSINTSLDFLTGCDCTDGCRDRTKCSCHRLTIDATSLCSDGPVDVTAGYTYKRLQTTLPTGVYECNPLCRCNPRICSNRLAQHGLQLRLELFMTQHKGWGIRCKDDVAKGTFVCVFTGKIVTEDKVNEDDMVSGNEYLANLDFIEGVEKLKEGYESEAYCSDMEIESNKKTITMKTGPLWKNTVFRDDSSSGEDKDEPMQLDDEHKKMDVCSKSIHEKKLLRKPQETNTQKNVTVLTNQKSADGPKRCFAMKSFERRVKALETSGTPHEKTKAAQTALNTRRLFDGEETCYVIDARQEGNLGRFINHSCNPNLFVQNVFVDTHDLRFPWVAFFASKRIKAGTELTWDYNYEVGSVEGKVLLCCCGSSRCTGRLL